MKVKKKKTKKLKKGNIRCFQLLKLYEQTFLRFAFSTQKLQYILPCPKIRGLMLEFLLGKV